jgi:hypothetical protein
MRKLYAVLVVGLAAFLLLRAFERGLQAPETLPAASAPSAPAQLQVSNGKLAGPDKPIAAPLANTAPPKLPTLPVAAPAPTAPPDPSLLAAKAFQAADRNRRKAPAPVPTAARAELADDPNGPGGPGSYARPVGLPPPPETR